MAEKHPMQFDLFDGLGAILGGAVAYLLTTYLPGFWSAAACAGVITLLSSASTRLTRPVFWWASVGAIAGSILGTGTKLAALLSEQHLEHRSLIRHEVVITLAVAGLVAGIFLGKDIEQTSMLKPADFLKRVSALTLVLYAIIVTAAFPSQGLDAVRTLSSRLSTMTTILVTTLAVPGWIGFRIGTRWGNWSRAQLAQRGLSVADGFRRHDAAPLQPSQGGARPDQGERATAGGGKEQQRDEASVS
jgi:hypothetical protein